MAKDLAVVSLSISEGSGPGGAIKRAFHTGRKLCTVVGSTQDVWSVADQDPPG